MNAKVVEQGRLGDGLAYFRVGTGRPLIYLPGLTTNHRPPRGLDLRFQASQLKPFGRHREVWWVQRREGLTPGTTMADIARDYAAALRGRFDGSVDVVGSSTGGAAALQLAADHPEAVRRLVLLSSACRLGPAGRDAQRNLAQLLRQGRTRQASAQMMSMLAAGDRGSWVLAKLGWILGLTEKGEGGVSDMLITIDAEDAFDLTSRLPKITTPTLVIGGARDRYYGAQVFHETASGLPSGRLLLYPDKGHSGTQTSRKTINEALHFLDESVKDAHTHL
jgi:pimeloyl-ACP methyl ester carboxylesterase